MKRFSQRSHLVTLSEINITPLLDLAFVLLIIFVITTPFLDQGLDLKLPTGRNDSDHTPDQKNIRTVEITARGEYYDQQAPGPAESTSSPDWRSNFRRTRIWLFSFARMRTAG